MKAESSNNWRNFARAGIAVGVALWASLAATTLLRAADSDRWGDLVGQFIYDGTPPERKKLKVDKDVECCGKFDIREESLMVGENGGLANVFVYLRTRRVDVCPDLQQSVKDKVVLDNRDCIFKPHCVTIWYTEQEYEIINSDPVSGDSFMAPWPLRRANSHRQKRPRHDQTPSGHVWGLKSP